MKSGNVYRNCAIIIREFLESLFLEHIMILAFMIQLRSQGKAAFVFDLNKIKNNNTMELIKDERRTIYLPSVCIAQEGYGIYNCMYVVHQLTDFSEYQKGSVGFVILCFDETIA